jgi:hypothetical protein
MESRYGEWISDVENTSGRTSVVSGEVFVKLPGATTALDQSGYSGAHILYQDVVIPAVQDGTSNTIMVAEKFQLLDGEYVLTAVQHTGEPGAAGSEDSRGLWQINVAPHGAEIQKGGWISDVSYERLPGESTVAMETLTITHEGIMLLA